MIWPGCGPALCREVVVINSRGFAVTLFGGAFFTPHSLVLLLLVTHPFTLAFFHAASLISPVNPGSRAIVGFGPG